MGSWNYHNKLGLETNEDRPLITSFVVSFGVIAIVIIIPDSQQCYSSCVYNVENKSKKRLKNRYACAA